MTSPTEQWSLRGLPLSQYPYDGTVVLLEARRAGSREEATFVTTGFSHEEGVWVDVEIEWQADAPQRIFLEPVRWYPMPKSLSAPALRVVK